MLEAAAMEQSADGQDRESKVLSQVDLLKGEEEKMKAMKLKAQSKVKLPKAPQLPQPPERAPKVLVSMFL